MNVKDDLDSQFVTGIIPHGKYVWCAIGPSIVRIDPKTRQMIDWFDGHTSWIDGILFIAAERRELYLIACRCGTSW